MNNGLNNGLLFGLSGNDIRTPDRDAIWYLQRLESVGVNLTSAQRLAIIIFIGTLKEKNYNDWNEILEIGFFIGSLNGSLVKLKYPQNAPDKLTNNGFVTGDFNSSLGLTGNGSNKSLDTGVSPLSYGLSAKNQCYGVYRCKAGFRNNATAVISGISMGTSGSGAYTCSSITNSNPPTNSLIAGVTPASTLTDRLTTTVARGQVVNTYSGGVLIDSRASATTSPVGTINLFRYNNSFYFNADVSAYYIAKGENMDAARVLRISNAFDTLHTAFLRIDLTAYRNITFGDSITLGSGASSYANSWAGSLTAAIGGIDCNTGISGNVFQSEGPADVGYAGNARFRSHIVANVVDVNKTRVFFQFGMNDLRYNNANYADPSLYFIPQTGARIDELLALGIPAANIYIGSPSYIATGGYVTPYSPAPYDGGSILIHTNYVAAIAALAATKGIKYFDHYNDQLANGGDALITADKIHPNDSGHARMKNGFYSVL